MMAPIICSLQGPFPISREAIEEVFRISTFRIPKVGISSLNSSRSLLECVKILK